MTSIVYQDRASGSMYIYQPKYPSQRSMFEQKKTERIIAAIKELEDMGNINIFLYKKGKLRKIAEHNNNRPLFELKFITDSEFKE